MDESVLHPSQWSDEEREDFERMHPEVVRFKSPNFAVTDARSKGAEALRSTFYDAAANLLAAAPVPTKSRAVALTELETAMMWAIKAYFGAPGEAQG